MSYIDLLQPAPRPPSEAALTQEYPVSALRIPRVSTQDTPCEYYEYPPGEH